MLAEMFEDDSEKEYEDLPKFSWRAKEGRFVMYEKGDDIVHSTPTLPEGQAFTVHSSTIRTGCKIGQSWHWDSVPGNRDSRVGDGKIDPSIVMDVTVDGVKRNWFAVGKTIDNNLRSLLKTVAKQAGVTDGPEVEAKGFASFPDFNVSYDGFKKFDVEYEEDGKKQTSTIYEPVFKDLLLGDVEPTVSEDKSVDELEDEIPF